MAAAAPTAMSRQTGQRRDSQPTSRAKTNTATPYTAVTAPARVAPAPVRLDRGGQQRQRAEQHAALDEGEQQHEQRAAGPHDPADRREHRLGRAVGGRLGQPAAAATTRTSAHSAETRNANRQLAAWASAPAPTEASAVPSATPIIRLVISVCRRSPGTVSPT